MLEHLRPQYAKSFRCLGSQCEADCCKSREIPIDACYESAYSDPRAVSSRALLLRRITEGTSLGGLVPRRMALRTGAYTSSLPASTERSMSPPRLISPRPTN